MNTIVLSNVPDRTLTSLTEQAAATNRTVEEVILDRVNEPPIVVYPTPEITLPFDPFPPTRGTPVTARVIPEPPFVIWIDGVRVEI